MQKYLKALINILTAPFRFIFWLFRSIYKGFVWFFRFIRRTFSNIRDFFTDEIDDTPLTDVLIKTAENPYGLFEHVDALRKHLFRAVLAMALTTILSFTFVQQIMEFLAAPIEGGLDSVVAIDVTESIGTVIRVSLLSGFALAFPYIALEIWLFIAPGVRAKSRLYGLLAIPIATLFFAGGLFFAYFVLLPVALPFLLSFMGIETIPRPSSYFNFVASILFWIGVAFEFPLVIFIMANMGLVKAQTLKQQWRLAIVVIAAISALITPTVDPVNMSLVMGPMILLYLLSILLAYIAQSRRKSTQESS